MNKEEEVEAGDSGELVGFAKVMSEVSKEEKDSEVTQEESQDEPLGEVKKDKKDEEFPQDEDEKKDVDEEFVEIDEDKDFDYDEEQEEDKEEEVNLSEVDDKMAVTIAKKEGRRRKELEAKYSELEVETNNYKEKIKELEDKINKSKMIASDPMKDEEYSSLSERLMADSVDFMAGIDHNSEIDDIQLLAKFSNKQSELNGLSVTERKAKVLEIREEIAFSLSGLSKEEWEEDIDEVRPSLMETAGKVFNFTKSISSDVKRLNELGDNIRNNSSEYALNKSAEQYQQKSKSLRESLSKIEGIDEETIELDPYSLESLAAKKIKSGKASKAYESVIKDIILAETGGRVYSAKERQLLRDQGKDDSEIDNLEKQSAKQSQRKKEQNNNIVLQYRLLQPEIKKLSKENAELKRKLKKQSDEDDEVDSLLSAKTKEDSSKQEEKIGFARYL